MYLNLVDHSPLTYSGLGCPVSTVPLHIQQEMKVGKL